MTLPDKIKALKAMGYKVELASVFPDEPPILWVTEKTTKLFKSDTSIEDIVKGMEAAKKRLEVEG